MAAKTVKRKAMMISVLVLLLIVAVDQVHSCAELSDDDEYINSKQRQSLLKLFEEAIMNDNYTLWKLQQIYFNPNSRQSSGQVCLAVYVNAQTIANLSCTCPRLSQKVAAFHGSSGYWHFDSFYELQLFHDVSGTSQLAKFLTKSGCTSLFYAMDPTVYSIMKTTVKKR